MTAWSTEMLGASANELPFQPHEAEVLLGAGQRAAGGLQDGRLEPGELVEKRAGVQDEDAAVPVEAAAGEIALRRGAVRLLEEGVHRERALVRSFQWLPLADVAVAGVRLERADAEQHERPLAATVAARRTASRKRASSCTTWSDGITARIASALSRAAIRAATAMAGAVLRATGSSTIAFADTPSRSTSSFTRKRWSLLHKRMGGAKPVSELSRLSVAPIRLDP